MANHHSESIARRSEWHLTHVIALIAIGFIGLMPLIANPGYYSHDEWQRFDDYLNNGFTSYIQTHSQIHPGPHFGFPVRPLAFLVQGIHNLFFRNYPFIVHLFSVTNTVLLSLVLYLGCVRLGLSRRTGAIAGFLFALGPLTTLSTGWSAALMDQMYVTFGLLALAIADRYIRDSRRGPLTLALIAAFAMAGVLSKETGIVFPATVLLLAALAPERLLPHTRRLVAALAAWTMPILLYLLYRSSAIEASFSGAQGGPYAASVAHIPVNIVVYWLYPFHPLITEVNTWRLHSPWSLWAAAALHSTLLLLVSIAYGRRRAFLYVCSYFLFLAPVLFIPAQGGNYLFASAIPLSVALGALITHNSLTVRFVAILMAGLISAHGVVLQDHIYETGLCMTRIATSLEAGHASAGFPEKVYLSTDTGSPAHVLVRFVGGFEGVTRIADRKDVRLQFLSADQAVPPGELALNMNRHCLLSVPQPPNLVVEGFGPQFTTAGVVPNQQPGGLAGFWIRVHGSTGPAAVHIDFDGQPSEQTIVGDRVIVAGISGDMFSKPGVYPITIRHVPTGAVIPVGVFEVKPSP